MAVTGQQNVLDARTTFETLVDGALQQQRQQGLYQPFVKERDGKLGVKFTFSESGALPTWERWVGTKNYRGFRKLSQDCLIDKYHKSLILDRTDVVHDQDGSTGEALSRFVSDVGYVYDKLTFETLDSNPLGRDGSAMLATSHTYVAYNNLTTSALSFGAYDAGRALMRSQQDEKGEYLDVQPGILLVHPDEERLAREIAEAEGRPVSVGTGGPVAINGAGVGATTTSNVFAGQVRVIATPRITSGNWFLLDPRFAPLGLVVWRAPESHITDSMSADSRMDNDTFKYSVESDINCVGLTYEGIYGRIQ